MKGLVIWLKNKSVKYKIMILSLIILIVFGISVFFYAMPAVEKSYMNKKREKVMDIVETAIHIIADLDKKVKENTITLPEAQLKAIEIIKAMRYGPEKKDYLWINDLYPKMIMHPFRSDLDGKDISDFADPKGKRLFVEMVSVCKQNGEGFVDYMWQYKDQADKIVPKISYVKEYKPWGWIVGTGIYIEDVAQEMRSLYKNAVLLFLTVFFIAVVVTYYIAKTISKPLEDVKVFSQSLAEGDLSKRIHIDQKDEIGVMAHALNDATNNLERLVAEVKVAVSNLTQAVNEIANGNENLSQRTSEQASSLEEIAATIEEATATIKQNAEHATRANHIAEKTRDLAKNGNELVNDAVVAINEINASSKRIGEILTLINEISFQTNLLALNAAVEAARAGEQGRGFAVVAGEVRNLAQRSGSAAKEIGELIRDSLDKIDTGTTLVNKSGEALKEIMQSIQELYKTITEIATASDEQKQGIDQINVAVSDLDTMTQQNAALVEETASASEEMANQAQELASMMERFVIREEISEKVFGTKHRELHLHAVDAGKKVAVKRAEKPKAKEEKKEAPLSEEKKEKGPNNKLIDDGFEEF
ncbi:MAG: methyl-accepting chemotaxis protein [Spirochaetota bacterium]